MRYRRILIGPRDTILFDLDDAEKGILPETGTIRKFQGFKLDQCPNVEFPSSTHRFTMLM